MQMRPPKASTTRIYSIFSCNMEVQHSKMEPEIASWINFVFVPIYGIHSHKIELKQMVLTLFIVKCNQ